MAYSEDVNINLNVLAGAMGGITAISSGMSALTSTFGEFGTQAVDNFGAIDGLLVSSAALVATFGVQAAQAFGEYEQGLKIAQTVSGQTKSAIAELSEAANQMSIQYRTSIGDITDGLQTLGRAGLNSAATQMEVLESGLQTAKLEGRNLNSVLEEIIQNTAMLGGDLKSVDFGAQTEYLNTLMVGTSMTAPITSHDISQTLQYAGGTAAAAGTNLENKDKLEDLMGTIAAFAQKGVTGSMAGTALRAFFTKPASQDKSVTNALDSIGLDPEDLWEDGGESMKKVSDQIGIIQRRMDALHLSTMEQVELWGKMVGTKMGQQMMKLDSSSIRELTADIQDANSAEDLAASTLFTYSQNISELQQKGDLAFRELGAKFANIITPIVWGLSKIMELFSNPVGNMFLFAGALGLIGNGLRAGYNMVKTLYSQITALFSAMEKHLGVASSETDGLTSSISRTAQQTEILNSKLHETDATLQSIQAKALNIDKPTWVANGGTPGEKVDRGVVASMPLNVFFGGKTESGLAIGEEGRLYENSMKQEIQEGAMELSKTNKAAQKEYAASQKSLREAVSKTQTEIGNLTTRLHNFDKKRQDVKDNVEELISGKVDPYNKWSRDRAIKELEVRKDFVQSSIESDPEWAEIQKQRAEADANLAKIKSDYGIVDEDIEEYSRLVDRKRELVEKNRQAWREFELAETERINKYIEKNHEKYTPDDDAYIAKPSDYLDQSLHDEGKEKSSINVFKKKHAAELDEIDAIRAKELEERFQKTEAYLKDPSISQIESARTAGTPSQIIEKEKRIKDMDEAIEALNEIDRKKFTEAYDYAVDKRKELIKQIEGYDFVHEVSKERLKEIYPTASKAEIKKMMDSLSDTMQSEIIAMEESIYQAEMARLKEAAASGDMVAKYSYGINKQIEEEDIRPQTEGYRAFAKISKTPEAPSPVISQAKKALASGIIDEFAEADKAFQQKIQQSLHGISTEGVWARSVQHGANIMDSYSRTVDSAKNRLSNFMTQLKWKTKGFDSLSTTQKFNQFEAVREAIAPLQGTVMYTDEALMRLMEETGLTAEQLAVLIQESKVLSLEFQNLATRSRKTGLASTKEEVGNTLGVLSKGEGKKSTSKLGSALNSMVGMLGGEGMAVIMGLTIAMEAFNYAIGNWKKAMSEATNKMSEAKDQVSTAEENIKELYSSENSSISEADLDKIVDYQYGSIQAAYDQDKDSHGKQRLPKFSDMYNNEVVNVQDLSWTDEEKENLTTKDADDFSKLEESAEKISLKQEENIEKLEENTIALNSATHAFSQALQEEAKAYGDGWFGFDSWYAWFIDQMGGIGSGFFEAFGSRKEGFFDHESGVLTGYQASDDYEGDKGMAALLTVDTYQSGVEGGLKQFYGSDYDKIMGMVNSIDGKVGSATDHFKNLTNNGFSTMSKDEMATAQMFFKEDPETLQTLAKSMFRYEEQEGLKSGHSAMEDWQTGKLRKRNLKQPHADASDAYKTVKESKYTNVDKNVKNTLNKIYKMTEGKLSYSNMLALGQLQMLQDMYSVANEQVYPILQESLIQAHQMVYGIGYTSTNTGEAASQDSATASNSAIIAGMLGAKLAAEATDLTYQNDYLFDPDAPKNPDTGKLYTKEEFTNALADLDDSTMDKYRKARFSTEMGFTARTNNPDWTPDDVQGYITRSLAQLYDSDGKLKPEVSENINHIDQTILSPALSTIEKMINLSYDQSKVGEYGSNSGTGSGSGSGDGSGSGSDKDKSGSTTSRVNLVLCSRKEIPKLNVNLFKKPPQFTVLNKNLKLNKLSINTQDKPNSIMNAVKNGLIETQQRLDPKIIQDEQAVYDPLAATDGSLPNGKSQVKTN